MRSCVRGNLMVAAWVLGAGLAAAGCAGPGSSAGDDGPRRTLQAELRRDTAAARLANQLGLQRLGRSDLDGAAEAFEQAIAADMEFGPAHNNLGKVWFLKKNWYRAAWEFESAARLLPQVPEPHNNLGLVLEEAGELDRAVTAYRQALALAADHREARANLARTLCRRGDRTAELWTLLKQVRDQDDRPAWREWALRQLAVVGGPGGATTAPAAEP